MRLEAGFAVAADAILERSVSAPGGVPGVAALVTTANETVYAGQAGVTALGGSTAMTAQSVVALYSCTKAVTATAVMQLVESGAIALGAPARHYVPEIADTQLLDGFNENGQPVLRAAASDVTVEQLLLHTAGFGYDMFDPQLARYVASQKGRQSRMAALMSVRVFEAGSQWQYGTNLDWAGKIVEAVRGRRLDEVMRTHVFEPLEMHDTGYLLTPAMRERRAPLHQRAADGTLTVVPLAEPPPSPDAHLGGSGLASTPADYLKFIRMILRGGAAPSGAHVLAPETVERMTTNMLGERKVRPLPGALPAQTNPVDLYPETSKSWGYSWMINDGTTHTGRPAGSVGWAGLANLYYWIDRRNGIGGFWATQILPFIDAASISGFLDFETAVYAHVR